VVQDAEIVGCVLRKNDRLIISQVSACHDEDAFPDDEQFIMDRFPNRYVAFGMGLHRCAGSHIARPMFKEMLNQVLQRMPDYTVVEAG
jgi:cytochrome P450